MPPKKATPKAPAAPKAARGGRQKAPARGKKEEEELSDEDLDEVKEQLKTTAKKRGPAKKVQQPASEEDEDELDEEEIDEDEEFDEEDDDEEEEEDDDEEDFGDKAKGGQAKQVSKQKQTLFIKNLPTETTPEQVKALSADITEVRMDVSQNKSEKNPKYAILEFSNPETAEKNLEKLRGQKVNGAEIYVDFVGGKSLVSFVKPQLTPSSDPLKLYVTGFGRDIIVDQLKEMFPTSSEITLPLNPKDNNRPVGYAFIHYSDEAIAKEAHDSMQDYVYQGRTLVVMYGKKTSPEMERAAQEGKRKAQPAKGAAAKKSKKNDEEEEEEEEDEDEEEDEEEEPEDEDEELDEEEDNE